MSLEPLARLLMVAGIVLFVIGGLIYLASRLGVNLFQLPGDIRFQSNNLTCIIPLVSSILLSIVLTVILNLVIRLLNK
jgi:heme/copper-type cytochrome/quinol oxidase subunit 2